MWRKVVMGLELKNTLIAICGPTASGKTALAIEVAKALNSEILSFDSRQFYKELKIGAAPPSKEELAEVKHHFIQHLTLNQDYNAGQFERDALTFLDDYFKSKKTIIAVGGSGMYLMALTEGFDDLPEKTDEVRKELNLEFIKYGLEHLLIELKEKDPDYFNQVDRNNHIRIIRALEVIRITGEPYSKQRKSTKKERPFNVLKIGIDYPREQLYNRINKRVDLMLEAGLLKEVESLKHYKNYNAMQTVGYREFFPYFAGEYDLDFAITEVKKFSRRYAKRQMTWFRKDKEVHWFAPENLSEVVPFIKLSLSL